MRERQRFFLKFCLCRRKSDLSAEEDNRIAVSANAAYNDVTWKAEEREREHAHGEFWYGC